MKEIKSITLILENCEVIPIDRKYIGSFHCKDMTAVIARTACNSISKGQLCREFYLELHKNADRPYSSFETEKTVFQRLAYPDITGIHITYGDDTKEACQMPWKDGDRSGNYNGYQTSYVSKCGNLYLCICSDKSIEDMIDFTSVDNAEEMETLWEMYS